MIQKQPLQILIDKYQRGACTEEEAARLESWYLQYNEEDRVNLEEVKLIKAVESIRKDLDLTIQEPLKISPLKKMKWQIAAAAVLAMVIGVYYYNVRPQVPESGQFAAHDIAPGKNLATLTRANGQVINLSEAKTGLQVKNARLTYSDGSKLGSASTEAKVSDNELLTASTPRGGTYQFILPDGSHVWLNAGSSIQFPAKFNIRKRQVVLKGEAYFQVTKDKERPFIVENEGQEVEVLGTHFNINSYEDEDAIRTTLLEGSVRVNAAYLKPGQQSVLKENTIKVVTADTEEAIAWKNGYFRFNNESIESIMRKVSRWYDVSIVYRGDFKDVALNGTISRDKNISQVLEVLQLTRLVHFSVEGRRIIVMQ